MKNILFVGMSPNQGGVETFMMNIFLNLKDQGFHFDFINNYDEPIAYSKQIEKNGGIIRNVNINPSLFGHLKRYKVAYDFFLEHHNYDVVHVNAVSINVLFWIRAAQQFNIKKLIIHSHNNNVKHKSKLINFLTKLLAIRNRFYLNKNSNITELSASAEAGRWMFHNNNFRVIRNGIDPNEFLHNSKLRLKFRKKLGVPFNDKVLITIARMESQKNYSKIIHIFNNVHKALSNTKLVIIGDGSEKDKIHELVDKLKLQNDVIFLGVINNVNELLNIADLMLLPSKYEAFPFSLVETQAAGIPSLVSSEAVPKESNITNELRYISLKKNNEYWANEAIKLLKFPYDIKEKRNMNNKVAQSKYSIGYLIKQIKKIYLN